MGLFEPPIKATMIYRLLLFLALNFGALAIGGFFTGQGVPSDWYVGLNKAPWTPPGWVFGAAWTTIMLCFSLYLALLWPKLENQKFFILVFGLQWMLNVAWNPLFFHFHAVGAALIIISALTLLVAYFIYHYRLEMVWRTLLLLPYLIWLLIATSLNAYIHLNN